MGTFQVLCHFRTFGFLGKRKLRTTIPSVFKWAPSNDKIVSRLAHKGRSESCPGQEKSRFESAERLARERTKQGRSGDKLIWGKQRNQSWRCLRREFGPFSSDENIWNVGGQELPAENHLILCKQARLILKQRAIVDEESDVILFEHSCVDGQPFPSIALENERAQEWSNFRK